MMVVAEGELVVPHCTMSGRHVRTLCDFGLDGRISTAFPPTGKRFATTQTHWFPAAALGWTVPSPLYLVRMALAKRHARKRAEAQDSSPS